MFCKCTCQPWHMCGFCWLSAVHIEVGLKPQLIMIWYFRKLISLLSFHPSVTKLSESWGSNFKVLWPSGHLSSSCQLAGRALLPLLSSPCCHPWVSPSHLPLGPISALSGGHRGHQSHCCKTSTSCKGHRSWISSGSIVDDNSVNKKIWLPIGFFLEKT